MGRPPTLTPGSMPVAGHVPERFQSSNVEMVEVIGGRFWKPYRSAGTVTGTPTPARPAASDPVGMDPDLYQDRPPIDLTGRRLRTLARALVPAYVRVSGTWANSVYFPGRRGDPCAEHRPVGSAQVQLGRDAERYTLSAPHVLGTSVVLNGRKLELAADDTLLPLAGVRQPAGELLFALATITLLVVPGGRQ